MKSEHSTRLHDVRADLQEVQDRIQRIEDDLRSIAEDPNLVNGNGNGASDHLDLDQINDSLRQIGRQQSQEAILESYLHQSEPFFERGVLFLKKESRYVAWRSVGFDQDSLEDVALESADSAVVRAGEQRAVISEDAELVAKFPWLGADSLPSSAVCLPLVFEDSSPVVLYADAAENSELDRGSLELLTQLAVLVLKNHYLSYLSLQPTSIGEVEVSDLGSEPGVESAEVKLGEPDENGWEDLKATGQELDVSPAEREEGDDEEPMMGGIPPFSTDDDEQEEVGKAAAKLEAAADDSWEDVESLSKEETWDAAEDDEARAEDAADEAIEEAEQAVQEALEHSGEQPFVLGASSLAQETGEAAEDAEEEPDQEAQAPDGDAGEPAESKWLDDQLQSVEEEAAEAPDEMPDASGLAPSAADSEEEAPHSEARRFARLLVSEIKLYNVDSIEEGRREKDLYHRLQRDIDRSRDMYEKRVHPSVRRETDYFHEEVLRILAGGDQDVLGGDYPGPQIEGA